MSKQEIKSEFVQWLKDNKVYDNISKEVQHARGVSVEEAVGKLPNSLSFPGYFIKDLFDWSKSITQKKDKAYHHWNGIHWKWKSYLDKKNLPDLSEFFIKD